MVGGCIAPGYRRMSPRSAEDDWDFTPAIDLIYCLSSNNESYSLTTPWTSDTSPEGHVAQSTIDRLERGTQLGNFDKIWQYLGQPLNVPPPTVPTEPSAEFIDIFGTTSDGAQSTIKGVRWRDELEGGDLADNDDINDTPDFSGLTKEQRKKARRKLRREAEAARVANKQNVASGSENESEKEVQSPPTRDTKRDTSHPSRKDVIYHILHRTTPKAEPRCLRSGEPFTAGIPIDVGPWPVAFPQVGEKAIKILKPPTKEQRGYAAAAAKKAELMVMLKERFQDEQYSLSEISSIKKVDTAEIGTAESIHVFVDASNIMIGFHDALKLSRGQPLHSRMRRQPLSFHNLSLILERGRPAAKRILVGSDNFPAIEEAKQIGYETNILDRVHKAKELTPRQKKYMNGNGNGVGTTQSGTGSGSETTAAAAAQYAPEKWVEQAVDEILHLKMMESIIDASEPATMVLATGDAAEAEYSGGFLKMVERALAKGWRVELASFRHNTSWAYKRKDFRGKWGEKFGIVELDDFVEVLLGLE